MSASSAMTGAARIIDSQDEVGGYPKVEPTKRTLEVPEKGRREWLETRAREMTFGHPAADVSTTENN